MSDWDVSDQNMVMLLEFQGRLAMYIEEIATSKYSVDVIKSMSN